MTVLDIGKNNELNNGGMIKRNALEQVLLRNLSWFENSGVMDPSDGSWGVAERVALTENNAALEKMLREFPAYSEYEGYTILEHRRADCNFQVALLYYLAWQITGRQEQLDVCKNILHFLFHRSGMRCVRDEKIPVGMWRWSAPQWTPTYWLDDNAWNSTICLLLSRDDALAKQFPLRQAGLDVAEAMARDLDNIIASNEYDPYEFWVGSAQSPHWGALVAMALAYAYEFSKDEKFAAAASKYLDYLETLSDNFTVSEQAYMALGANAVAKFVGGEELVERARKWNDILLAGQSESGHLPSQWKETPAGENLVDMVYTQNWSTLSWQAFAELSGEEKYRQAAAKSMELLCRIQDASPARHLTGCWRGLYDLQAGDWGGGDCYEGGASSIYTGWTNAPISIAIALEMLGKSLVSI